MGAGCSCSVDLETDIVEKVKGKVKISVNVPPTQDKKTTNNANKENTEK
jgi:hypothetical protein